MSINQKPFNQKRFAKNNVLPSARTQAPTPSTPAASQGPTTPPANLIFEMQKFTAGKTPLMANSNKVPSVLHIDSITSRRVSAISDYLSSQIIRPNNFKKIIKPELLAQFDLSSIENHFKHHTFGDALGIDQDLAKTIGPALRIYTLVDVDADWEMAFPLCKDYKFILWEIATTHQMNHTIESFFLLDDIASVVSVKNRDLKPSPSNTNKFMSKVSKIIGIEFKSKIKP
jgi:hypothetical protein